MAKRHYPRYDSRRPLPKNTTKVCEFRQCDKQATSRVFVQVNFMRGEDEDYCVCDEHRKFVDPDHLDEWVNSMRPVMSKP